MIPTDKEFQIKLKPASSLKKHASHLWLIVLFMMLFGSQAKAQVTVSGSTGANATYSKLKLAFDAINITAQTNNNVIITITASTTETESAVLNAGVWTTLVIYPTTTGLSIAGNLAGPLININGADNVTINGSLNGANSGKDLTITNTSTSNATLTSTICFSGDASSNTVKYCTIKGSQTAAAGGIILFTSGTTLGNNSNTIDHNDITCAADANRPVCAIYSRGLSETVLNSSNTISNNNIYNFLNRGISSYGIYLDSNTSATIVSGNSYYETSSFVPTVSVAYTVINTNGASGGTISNNYIGGSVANCGGTAWTKTNAFDNTIYAMYLNGTGTVSVQGNTIANFNAANSGSAGFIGIACQGGDSNIGSITGNTIGAAAGTGSIVLTNAGGGDVFRGIFNNSSGVRNIRNNTIGSVTLNNSTTLNSNFYGMYISGNTSPGTTISNNTIGSTTTANSINATSESTGNAQDVYGVFAYNAGTITISGNTIANLKNSTTYGAASNGGRINGIYSYGGTNTISNNTVRDLTTTNQNYAADATASIIGIVQTSTTAAAQTVSGNTIYNLSNTKADFIGYVYGLYYSGSTTASTVSGNFIHSLALSSNSGSIYGMRIKDGTTTYSNNIISIVVNTATSIAGIWEDSGNNNFYFNTVYIGGAPTTGGIASYGMLSVGGGIKIIANNLFINARSNSGSATGSNFAIYINSKIALTTNYNDYYASGTGKVLGYYWDGNKTTIEAWRTASLQDNNSVSTDPLFASAGGTAAANYIPSVSSLNGVNGTGITSDYTAASRSYNSMGAYDYAVNLLVRVASSTGTLSGNYFTLKGALDAINTGIHTGDITITINTNTTETASAVLNASGSGSASYNSVLIYPTASGLSITGNLSAPLINLNGADHVTIDGRVNAAGSAKDLTISNLSTSATAGTSTIRFYNDASDNSVKYCALKGSSVTGEIVTFSTGTATGNDNNLIDHNDLTNAGGNRPQSAIISYTSLATMQNKENSGNTISNNNIFDFLNPGLICYGIIIYDQYATAWTISGNNFYETSSFAPTATAAYTMIYIESPYGINFTVSDNHIGGNAPGCAGTWTKTNAFDNAFTGILLKVGSATASNIQGNTISNFAYSNSGASAWTGISIGGSSNVNIGTTSGNTIGAPTGTGSISFTAGAANASFYGISTNSSGSVDIRNNTIGSITAANSVANSTNFYGIWKNTSAGTTTIINNTIGSNETANSINATSPYTDFGYTQLLHGIYCSGTGIINISGNTISSLTNATTHSAGSVAGFYYKGSPATSIVSGNFITNLSATSTATIYGIQIAAGTASGTTNFYNNIISLGSNTPTTIYGIYETGYTGYNNNLYFNTVYIGGTAASDINLSYAMYSAVTTNTRNFRNNIFNNSRSNNGATGTHYAAFFNYSASTNLTLNYNDYYAPGTGGVLGRYASANVLALPLITGLDANSSSTNPIFGTPGGTTAASYLPSATSLAAVTGTGITTDFDGGDARSVTYPAMGAFEYAVTPPCTNPTSGGTIAADQTICSGTVPAAFTSSTAASGNTGTLEYKWQLSTTSNSSGFNDIASSNAVTYSPGSLTARTWYKRLARVSCMGDWTGAAESNVILVKINQTPVDQTISPESQNICSGNSATISIGSSESSTSYYLRDNSNNAVVDGPKSGTGSAINFNTGNLSSTKTYNVYAEKTHALNFDGSNDYVSVSHTFPAFSNYTVSTWVYLTNVSGAKFFSSSQFELGVSSGKIQLWIAGHDGINGTTDLPLNQWNYISVTFSGTSLDLYINGNLDKSVTTSVDVLPSVSYLAIGKHSSVMCCYVTGSMGELSFESNYHTQAEIQSKMVNGYTGAESGLVAYYNFEDGTGSPTLTDRTANHFNGTLVNMDTQTAWILSCSKQMTPTVTVNVLLNNTAGAASSSPTLCLNSTLTAISHTTTGATGIGSATGLPAGVTAAFASNTITISGTPTASGTFNYSIPLTGGCGNVNATGTITVNPPSFVPAVRHVSDLTATGENIKWYAAASGGSALASTDVLPNGTTHYYASQTVNGVESTARFHVVATVDPTPCTPSGSATQTVSTGATVASLQATGTTIRWYADSSGGDALATSTALVSGNHYYATQTINCTESATRFDLTVTIVTLAIGVNYGGGIVAYILQSGDDGYSSSVQHGLIAATTDQSINIKWSNTSTVTNAVRDGIGAGMYNTELIIANQGVGSYAAQLCANYQGGDYGDWYLPSKYELNLLYLQKTAVGVFANAYYWSSNEYSSTNAWIQHFASGDQINTGKSGATYVRAIRAF